VGVTFERMTAALGVPAILVVCAYVYVCLYIHVYIYVPVYIKWNKGYVSFTFE